MSSSILTIFIFLMLALMLLGLYAIFIKVKLGQKRNSRFVALSIENNFRKLQAYYDLRRIVSLPYGLPPLVGWAAFPDFLLLVAKHVLQTKPNVIVECSSGASTLVMAKCLSMNGSGHVYSIENDAVYAAKTQSTIDEAGLSDWVTILVAPIQPHPEFTDHQWYSTTMLPEVAKVDVLVVDGPPRHICSQSRYPALPSFVSSMELGATVFLDDTNRKDEKAIAERWLNENSGWTLEFLDVVKGAAKLTKR